MTKLLLEIVGADVPFVGIVGKLDRRNPCFSLEFLKPSRPRQDGNVYPTSGVVHVFDPTAKKLAQMSVTEGPSKVCFGGTDRKTLLITPRKGLDVIAFTIGGDGPKQEQASVRFDPTKIQATVRLGANRRPPNRIGRDSGLHRKADCE